jgi:hypothetical protein
MNSLSILALNANLEMKRLAILIGFLAVLGTWIPLLAEQPARFFKAECGTAAGYIELATDGTYTTVWREHMGVFVQEQGRWGQKQEVITFAPNGGKSSYEGAVARYKGKTFLVWKSENAAGIVVPVEETQRELDKDPKRPPMYVFFETDGVVYQRETKEPYPFRYVKPVITHAGK